MQASSQKIKLVGQPDLLCALYSRFFVTRFVNTLHNVTKFFLPILRLQRKFCDIRKLMFTKNENVIKIYTVTRQPIFIEIIFSRILSVPNRRTSKRNFGSPKQIREKEKRPITNVCLGLPKFRLEVLGLGTLRIREKIIL